MNINKFNTANYFNYSNSKRQSNKTTDDLWNRFKSSKDNTEKRKLLNQLNALECSDDEDREEDEKCTSKNEKVIKDFNKKRKEESIAAKVARGEYISEKERIYLEAHDPDLLEKSRYMNYERKNLEQKIRNAKTKEQAKKIIINASSVGVCLGDDTLNKVALKTVDKAKENTESDMKKKEQEKRRKKRHHINTSV